MGNHGQGQRRIISDDVGQEWRKGRARIQVTTVGGERPGGCGGVLLVCVGRTGESTLGCANFEDGVL